MDPATLSASAIATFETCEARYYATYIEKGREISGAPATLGTTVHAWLEWLVVNGYHLTMDLKIAMKEFDVMASSAGLDSRQIADAKSMIARWWKYHEENGFNEVLSCEVKETFTLTHPLYDPIPVTYIWDRGDLLPDGSIEVVDYKTVGQPIAADNLRTKVQPRVYGVSAAIKYKHLNPPMIWVQYWLLRFGNIGTGFTREDNMATWKYLQDVYGRIKESEGMVETINTECKWCVRKAVCDTLHRHSAVGGIMGLDPRERALKLAETKNKLTALNTLRDELETMVTDDLDNSETLSQQYDGVKIFIKPTARRSVDKERASKVLGPDLMAKWGDIGVGTLDEILKKEELTDEQRLQLKQLIRQNPGAELKVEITTPFDEL